MSEESRMIPGLLREVAKSIRDLVAAGKAVHVDLDVARELDMIATFPWPDVSMLVDDIAWAWLKLSRGRETREDAEQAAKYAEVLLIAAQVRINFTGCLPTVP